MPAVIVSADTCTRSNALLHQHTPGHALLLQTGLRVLANGGQHPSGLFLKSEPGPGVTHLTCILLAMCPVQCTLRLHNTGKGDIDANCRQPTTPAVCTLCRSQTVADRSYPTKSRK
eukprot:scpid96083/ scgid29851/ 